MRWTLSSHWIIFGVRQQVRQQRLPPTLLALCSSHLHLALSVADVHGALGVERGHVGDEPVRPQAQHQPLHNLRVVLMVTIAPEQSRRETSRGGEWVWVSGHQHSPNAPTPDINTPAVGIILNTEHQNEHNPYAEQRHENKRKMLYFL